MSKLPLLFFPTPQLTDRTKRSKPLVKNIHKPNETRQSERLSPMFAQLLDAFEARRVEIQSSAIGVDPEKVLVIKTIGGIENFISAVKRIKGFEWLGEFEVGDIEPDEDFYDEKNSEKELDGYLYLVMTNQRALQELVSLWGRYKEDPNMKFDRGLTKFRDVFRCLKCIREWGIEDRLIETGMLDLWKDEIKCDADRVILFEVELWFRGNSKLREISEKQVTELILKEGGKVLSQSVIEGIAYHGLLAELPAKAIQAIVENPSTELVKCESIMFFRPVGQMVAGDADSEWGGEVTQIEIENEKSPMPTGGPVVALLDGLPLTNHCLLTGRLIIDDPDGWEADYAANERIHGSSMASLIVHGDLNQHLPSLSRPVYVRPIMKPMNSFRHPRPEGIPENCLAIDLIHRAVRRIFEGDQQEEPVAPQIRVINLSIGDLTRQFVQSMSPLARLLDWLSVKYGVLFIVSAGNHSEQISLGVSKEQFDELKSDELEEKTIKALFQDIRNRKLLSPAETINGLTVGAVHHDTAKVDYPGGRIDPFKSNKLPSPVSAFGSGYRRAIKPDIVYYGGRQWYQRSLPQKTNFVSIEPVINHLAPGNKVAFPGGGVGALNSTSYSCGTSNATALISRAAGICYDSMQQIIKGQDTEVPMICEAPLLKAMLVHGCSWRDMGSRIFEIFRNSENAHHIKGLIAQWMGYGIPNVDRVMACTEQRATILGFGTLSNNEAHIFEVPLPPSLGSRAEKRRLTVTLAWLSPILANTHKYRTASLWFEVLDSDLTPTRIDADWNAVRRGTVQHEIFEGQKAEPFTDDGVIRIKVNCREDAGKIQEPIAYGLVVSLEVAEGVDIDVYNEICTRIKPEVQIQQAVN